MTIIINKGQVNELKYNVNECINGTEKQVAYANNLKSEKIADLLMYLYNKSPETVIEWADKMNAIVDSNFWLDRKDDSYKDIAKEVR